MLHPNSSRARQECGVAGLIHACSASFMAVLAYMRASSSVVPGTKTRSDHCFDRQLRYSALPGANVTASCAGRYSPQSDPGRPYQSFDTEVGVRTHAAQCLHMSTRDWRAPHRLRWLLARPEPSEAPTRAWPRREPRLARPPAQRPCAASTGGAACCRAPGAGRAASATPAAPWPALCFPSWRPLCAPIARKRTD